MVANDEGRFAERAAQILRTKITVKTRMRMRRSAKASCHKRNYTRWRADCSQDALAHFHHVLYAKRIMDHAPEKPWIIEHGGHVDYEAPNWPMVE